MYRRMHACQSCILIAISVKASKSRSDVDDVGIDPFDLTMASILADLQKTMTLSKQGRTIHYSDLCAEDVEATAAPP